MPYIRSFLFAHTHQIELGTLPEDVLQIIPAACASSRQCGVFRSIA